MIERFRHRVFHLLEDPAADDRLGRGIQIFLIALIILNVAAVVAETVEGFAAPYERWLYAFEVFSVAVFTVEYLLRAWVCTRRLRYRGPVLGRIRHALTPLALVDLVAILPFFLPVLLPVDLRFIRALRLMRLARLLKIGRHSKSLRIMGQVIKDRKEELLATFSVMVVLAVVSAGLMYFIEREAQPDVFSSIPAALWWAVATLTTMTGDMRPVTLAGRILAGVIAVCGIGLFALPAGILGSGFVERFLEHRKGRRCPHCGKDLRQPPEPPANA
jgi:voltage-gated potassium channel